MLLTVRKFYSATSVSFGPEYSDEDEDEEPTGPVDHHTMPLQPIPEPLSQMDEPLL